MPRLQRLLAVTSAGLLVATGIALAQQTTVDINRISESGVGDKIGTIVLSEAKDGAVVQGRSHRFAEGPARLSRP